MTSIPPAIIEKNNGSDDEVETHPAYGMIGLSRVSGDMTLAGSSIKHGNTIKISIREAERHHSVGREWFFGRKELIQVYISGTQLGDMLTSMNMGDGVPCTIARFDGEGRPAIRNIETPKTRSTARMKQKLDNVLANSRAAVKEAQEMFKNTAGIKKADKERLLTLLCYLENDLNSNLTYAAECFDEKMEKTISEAKGEVESFVSAKIISAGLQALVANGEYKPVQIECESMVDAKEIEK